MDLENGLELVSLARELYGFEQLSKSAGLWSDKEKISVSNVKSYAQDLSNGWIAVSSDESPLFALNPMANGLARSKQLSWLLFCVAKKLKQSKNSAKSLSAWIVEESEANWRTARVKVGESANINVAWPIGLCQDEQVPEQRLLTRERRCRLFLKSSKRFSRNSKQISLEDFDLCLGFDDQEEDRGFWRVRLIDQENFVLEEYMSEECLTVPATIELGTISLPLEATFALKPGVEIKLNMPAQFLSTLTVDGMPIAQGELKKEGDVWSFVVVSSNVPEALAA